MEEAEASFNTWMEAMALVFRLAKSSYRLVGKPSITYRGGLTFPVPLRLLTPRMMIVGAPPLAPLGEPSPWIYKPGTCPCKASIGLATGLFLTFARLTIETAPVRSAFFSD